jgi:hypothetical protein
MLRVASNLSTAQLAALSEALGGSTTQTGFADADLIVLEARGGHQELTDPQAAAITERVRQGAALIVALSEGRQHSSVRLGRILPSTTWQAAGRYADAPPSGKVLVGWSDPEFFGSVEVKGRALPSFFTVEPMAAEERGQSRYANYQRKLWLLDEIVEPGDQFWTRSLLLRDVKVRMHGSDNAATPLLATGRYGAGRTLLFGSSFDQLMAGPSLLPASLAWLKPENVATPGVPGAAPELTLEYGRRSLLVRLRSKASAPLTVEVVGRAYTWENAPLGFEHDFLKAVTLPPGQVVSLEMPFPEPAETMYQAMEYRDVFRVRLAVLGTGGAATLVERQLLADFSPAVGLEVMTDDVDDWEYPFHAPGPNFQRAAGDRMGARIGAYAYPPGAKVKGSVVLSNGVRDLGAIAVVADETTPGNPSATSLLDGAIVGGKKPIDTVAAYSMWIGKPGVDNTLTFSFPNAVTLTAVTLVGDFRLRSQTNPDAALVQMDGRKVASGTNLVSRFVEDSGNVRFEFEPASARQVRLTLSPPNAGARRRGVALTEVRFEGWTGSQPSPVSGDLVVTLEDAKGGASRAVLRQSITLKPGERRQIAAPFELPEGDGTPEFYRLQASFDGQMRSAPIVALIPPRPMPPLSDLIPPDAPSLGFIVTEGFRNCFPLGAGTAERIGAWASPDDLIWAYSRQMKEVGAKARTEATRLYVTEGDMRHYSQPWRTFSNGIPLFTEATPTLVSQMSKQPHWEESKVAHLSNSDRWDTGPQVAALHGWQDFVEFDAHLRASGKAPLAGRTRQEISEEIHGQHEDDWQAWQLNQYLNNLRTLREGFAARGKRLLITAQGCPVIAGPAGAEVAETVQGMSDDCSWGMAEASTSLTMGRQLAESAHNPVWKMTTLLQYGFNTPILNSPEWHSPVGTLEPSRRQYYSRAWRSTIWNDGSYSSVYFGGYAENVGVSYQMTENDWVQWWRLEERHSLISAQAPLGAGLVMSTIRFADPNHIRFTAGSIFDASTDGVALARVFQRLHDAGLSIPFSANATALAKWKGSAPLIVLIPEVYSDDEIATLEALQARGIKMVAFSAASSLQPRTAALFRKPGTLIKIAPAELGIFDAEQLVPKLTEMLDLPLRFGEGVSGYGFTMSGTQFVVVEENRNAGRGTEVRLRATEGKQSAQACEVNDHHALKVRRDGSEWVIDVPLRPGDAQLVALREA